MNKKSECHDCTMILGIAFVFAFICGSTLVMAMNPIKNYYDCTAMGHSTRVCIESIMK